MNTLTSFGQMSNPFFMDINPKKFNKDELNLKDKNKEFEEEYLSALNSQSKNEILALKQYIQKMNEQIRLQLRMELIPSLEEKLVEYSRKIKNGNELNEKCYESLNNWLNQILNVDYVNPLITLYDKYIKSLEDELKNSKKMNKKYENTIDKIVNENNDLRNQLKVNEEEMRNFLGVRNEGDASGMLVTDKDYIMKIEERNQLLSQENEILFINYTKLQNELNQIKRGNNFYNDKTGNDKIERDKYNKLYQQYKLLEKNYKVLQDQYNSLYKKNNDFANDYYKLQNENKKYYNENELMKKSYEGLSQMFKLSK